MVARHCDSWEVEMEKTMVPEHHRHGALACNPGVGNDPSIVCTYE
jgi:hypothetical protein